FSTAPFCIGVPVAGRTPLVLDFATSIVSEGKVMVASQGGKAIPAQALIGPDGRTSNDPRLLYGEYASNELRDPRKGAGAIRAFGEHKGSGLALMCEILGGALSGTGCTSPARRFANGMFSFYIDPARIDPDGLFSPEVVRYLAYVKEAKPARPGSETLIPGEPEERSVARRQADGVALPADTWHMLLEAARSVGLDENRVRQADNFVAR
ncbi:MAG: Ldh family oxidoreductase, partial [Burkholderiales bacterium]